MDPEQIRAIVEEVTESFFNPHAARRWVESKHPRDKSGKFAGSGGEDAKDSPLVDARKASRQIRKLKKEQASVQSKLDDIDSKKAMVKELAGKVADARGRKEEFAKKAAYHKARAQALRAMLKSKRTKG